MYEDIILFSEVNLSSIIELLNPSSESIKFIESIPVGFILLLYGLSCIVYLSSSSTPSNNLSIPILHNVNKIVIGSAP